MGNSASMLTHTGEIEEHCNNLFTQQEIVSLHQRFRQLDVNSKGFVSADEFMSVPEFALNPLAQRLLKKVDGLNFMDFVGFLSAFSTKATIRHKIKFIFDIYDSNSKGKVTFNDVLEVLQDLTGAFMSDAQREEVLTRVFEDAGYTRESYLLLDDFIKILGNSDLKMEVEIPVD
ncbi:Calcineurin subunit B type 1-like protein [Drosera capensis]